MLYKLHGGGGVYLNITINVSHRATSHRRLMDIEISSFQVMLGIFYFDKSFAVNSLSSLNHFSR